MQRKITLLIFTTLLLSACEDEYQRGYRDGKSDGYSQGKDDGYQEGHKVGYDEGHKVGHSEGYTLGYSEGHDAGYWEGTQFLVQDSVLPSAGGSIIIAICLATFVTAILMFYKSWLYFFKEKWIKRQVTKQLEQMKQSEIFRNKMNDEIQRERLNKKIQEELSEFAEKSKSDKLIRQLILDNISNFDAYDGYHDLYINILNQIAESRELSNQFKLKLYSEILILANKDIFDKEDNTIE